MIERITITGADNSTEIEMLDNLVQKYQEIEFGILVSARHAGEPRYPSYEWIAGLINWVEKRPAYESGNSPRLSLHVCGQWAKDILIGKPSIIRALGKSWWEVFQRVQLNFHGEDMKFSQSDCAGLLGEFQDKQFIFQMDGKNERIFELMTLIPKVNVVPLFDKSGGCGVTPEEWPKPYGGRAAGYAGGLGPANLEREFPEIIKASGDTPGCWIDMETRVRTNDDQRLDWNKVRACLNVFRSVKQVKEGA